MKKSTFNRSHNNLLGTKQLELSPSVKAVALKAKKALSALGRENAYIHVMPFSTKTEGERKRLRQRLVREIKNSLDFKNIKKKFDWDLFDWGPLLKPGSKAQSLFATISISHCEGFGAFVFVFEKNLSIGWDLEKKNRITEKIVGRISSEKELKSSPSPPLLWTAKEAVFKCFSNSQSFLLLSDGLISHWIKDKEFYFFKGRSKKTDKEALGVACFINNLVLAYAESSPLFKS